MGEKTKAKLFQAEAKAKAQKNCRRRREKQTRLQLLQTEGDVVAAPVGWMGMRKSYAILYRIEGAGAGRTVCIIDGLDYL